MSMGMGVPGRESENNSSVSEVGNFIIKNICENKNFFQGCTWHKFLAAVSVHNFCYFPVKFLKSVS